MALNPAFASSTTRRLPLAFGYVYGEGDRVLFTTDQNGNQYALYILGEGEWDGPALLNSYAATGGSTSVPSHMLSYATANAAAAPLSNIVHFHGGAWTPKGTFAAQYGGSPVFTNGSVGPDQSYDPWFSIFPSVTPPQSFSGMAYALWRAPVFTGFTRGTWYPPTISGNCVWRSSRCRIFDAYGNITAYQFTCNPAWHKVEALLRYKIKPQQPTVAGLTAAEKACFNWASIAALAARNDYILPNGSPRFTGNYIFAADATLASIMETMMRVDRSYCRVDGGQIYLIGDDSRTSVFIASANHEVPGSLKLSKKDIATSPNVFVPRYRDLNIPAVSEVVSVAPVSGVADLTFDFSTQSPFTENCYFIYGGSSAPANNGEYNTGGHIASGTYLNLHEATLLSGASPVAATGGVVGSNDARFSERAPTGVQHRSAQKMVALQAPGLSSQPRMTPVYYDCGNSTFDQTNRLMKFERDRTLGTDRGAGWTAPLQGTLTCYLDVTDANLQQLIAVVRQHSVVTLDSWLTPEFTGLYEVLEMAITAPSGDDLGKVELTLMSYNPNAPTDVSDDPGSAYATVPGSSLPLTGFTPVANAAWVLQSTPSVSGSGPLTVAIPDLSIQVLGQPTPTAYPGFSVAGVPSGSPVCLYVDDPSGIGTSPSYGFQSGTGPLTSPPAGRMLVMIGTFS